MGTKLRSSKEQRGLLTSEPTLRSPISIFLGITPELTPLSAGLKREGYKTGTARVSELFPKRKSENTDVQHHDSLQKWKLMLPPGWLCKAVGSIPSTKLKKK